MAAPNGGESGQRRVGWWGWNRDYGWDDQGCLGCGLAWWIAVLCCFVIFGFWGWGVPGWGGWAGWGWRHNVNNDGYNCQCPGQTGTTNMQPGSGQPAPAQTGAPAQPGVGGIPSRDGGSTAPSP